MAQVLQLSCRSILLSGYRQGELAVKCIRDKVAYIMYRSGICNVCI